MKLRLNPRRRYSPERAWAPLSDDEWAVLAPFVLRAAGAAGFGLGSALYKPGMDAAEVGRNARAFAEAWRALKG